MQTTIQISKELHLYLVRKTQGKESFDATLRRLLGSKRGRPPKPKTQAPVAPLEG